MNLKHISTKELKEELKSRETYTWQVFNWSSRPGWEVITDYTANEEELGEETIFVDTGLKITQYGPDEDGERRLTVYFKGDIPEEIEQE